MAVTKLKRTFTYNDMVLDDPNESMTPDQVRDFYAEIYPELTQATISAPETTAHGLEYAFDKIVGSKGSVTLEQLANIGKNKIASDCEDTVEAFRLMNGLNHLIESTHGGEAVLPPSSVLGMI